MENHYIMYCVSITMKIDLQELNAEWKWKVQCWQSYIERGGYLISKNTVYIIDIKNSKEVLNKN